MVEFPSGMRLAAAGDEGRLYDLFLMAHMENGWGDVDESIVRTAIARGCKPDGVVIALVDGPERIEAAIGLHPVRPWYCSDAVGNWYNSDLLIYVHPLHRRSRHAVKLFHFAQWWEAKTGMPALLGLLPKDDLEDKERLFSKFGRRIGGLYVIDSAGRWPEKAAA
jgi:hypothetical protein